MDILLTNHTASMTEVKRNLPKILKESGGKAVAILNHNKAEAYLVPVELYKELIEKSEAFKDAKDLLLLKNRENGPFIEVDINEL